jgi:DNA polymerase III subunit epsilon
MSLFSWLLPRKTPVLSLDQQQRLLQLAPAPGLGETSLRSSAGWWWTWKPAA